MPPTITTKALTLVFTPLVAVFISYVVILPVILCYFGSQLLARSNAKRELLLADRKKDGIKPEDRKIIGFFHPYCNAGGGGERVLWAAIHAIQASHPSAHCVVYTGDQNAPPDLILGRIQTRFSISLDSTKITFLYLTTRRYVAATTWPHFTLAGQSLGSLILAWEALSLCVPDVFIDTMGYAFAVGFAKSLFPKNIKTAAYVHYPTISTDMLAALPTNTSSTLRTNLKRTYWKLFALAYSRCGTKSYIDRVMVNSTWTSNHINQLWKRDDASILFPPCAVTELLAAIPSTVDSKREKILLCIAQFRPEKSHSVLIKSFAKFMAKTKEHKDAKLVLVGSVRNSEDATRVYDLRLLAHELGVRDNVIFVTDAPWSDVLDWLKRAWAGVNGMWNEHFGIGVVEYQAAGLVGVVHKSGGPYLDIYKDDCGVHCLDEEEFAAGFEKVLGMDEETIKEWRDNARKSARRFDEETFEKGWEKEMQMLGLGERKE